MAKDFDVVGLGLSASDTMLRVSSLPLPGGKTQLKAEAAYLGGQVATACVVCQRYGYAASFAGAWGDDPAGIAQEEELRREGVDLSQVRRHPGRGSQQSWIFVEDSGERTILYDRPAELALTEADVCAEWVARGRILHVDGHDAAAAARAAEAARALGTPVSADLASLYPEQQRHTERLLRSVDYLLAAEPFPHRLTGIAEPVAALAAIRDQFGIRVAGVTLGPDGALARDDEGCHYAPGFVVDAIDTTGAGDVFHGGFLIALLRNWRLDDALEFACALAALNCTAAGCRGHIASEAEVESLRRFGRRRARPGLAS